MHKSNFEGIVLRLLLEYCKHIVVLVSTEKNKKLLPGQHFYLLKTALKALKGLI